MLKQSKVRAPENLAKAAKRIPAEGNPRNSRVTIVRKPSNWDGNVSSGYQLLSTLHRPYLSCLILHRNGQKGSLCPLCVYTCTTPSQLCSLSTSTSHKLQYRCHYRLSTDCLSVSRSTSRRNRRANLLRLLVPSYPIQYNLALRFSTFNL